MSESQQQQMASDLIAVLTGLAPELESLMNGETLFKVLPAGAIPVRLPAALT